MAEAALLLLIGLVAAGLAAGDTGEIAISIAGWSANAPVSLLLMVTLGLVIVRTAAAYDTQRALAKALAGFEAHLRRGAARRRSSGPRPAGRISTTSAGSRTWRCPTSRRA